MELQKTTKITFFTNEILMLVPIEIHIILGCSYNIIVGAKVANVVCK